MSSSDLVDSTRAWWGIHPERERCECIEHAVAVHQGITRAVVEIGDWSQRSEDRRWAFSATLVTEGSIYDEWIGPSGRTLNFVRGDQSPIRYWTPS